MNDNQVVFYDYEHCRPMLEGRVKHLRETTTGLNMLALYRDLIYKFAGEALDTKSLTLVQFDQGIVYLFIPQALSRQSYPSGHKVARTKALELLRCTEPPLVLELLAAQNMEPSLHEKQRISCWMKQDFLMEVVGARRVEIQMYFNACSFLEDIIRPELTRRGFSVADNYKQAAQTGQVRLRHPDVPGKLYRLPWLQWIREMMAGGYSVVYLMACLGNYLNRLEQTVAGNSNSTVTKTGI